MKIRACFILLFLIIVNSYSAYSVPFIVNGKRWHIRSYNQESMILSNWGENPDEEYDLCFLENSDTVIYNNVYSRLTHNNCMLVKEYEMPGLGDKEVGIDALLREENGKVYIYSEKTKKEYLLYDFNLNKGDSFTMEAIDSSGEYECHVEDVSYITCNGEKVKRILLSSVFTDYQYGQSEGPVLTEWTEGFGGQTPVCQPLTEQLPGGTMDIMSYVTYPDYTFLPMKYDYMYFKGQQLLLGKDVTDEMTSEKTGIDELSYEFTDDFRLHVYGMLWTNKSPNQYIHCTIRQRDDVSVYDITFDIDVLEPISENIGAFTVDFYFDDFYLDPYKNSECHIHDSAGEHILILNKQDMSGISFISSDNEDINTIYDLSGRRLAGPPEHGVYIQGGRVRVR